MRNNIKENGNNIFIKIIKLCKFSYPVFCFSCGIILSLFINYEVFAANTLPINSSNEMFRVTDNIHSYKGIKNSNGKILIKPLFYDIRTNNNENYYAVNFPSYSVYSLEGEKLLEIPNASVEYYDDNFAIIRDEFGYYLSDKNGKKLSKHYYQMRIEPYFTKVILFFQTDKDKYAGVMNSSGKIISFPTNSHCNNLIYAFPTENGGIIGVSKNTNCFLTDNNGKKIKITEDDYYGYLKKYEDKQNTYTAYNADYTCNDHNNFKWGITEDNNKTIVENKYEKTSIATGNTKYFGYKSNNLWGVKSLKNEEIILLPKFDKEIKVVNDYILVNTAPLGIYFDKNCKKIFELNNEELCRDFEDGFAVVVKHDKYKYLYGFIDKNGKIAIPCQYNYAENFSEGLAAVKNEEELWGYIDKKGKVVIDFKYKYANSFKDKTARVKTIDNKYIKINKNGKEIQ